MPTKALAIFTGKATPTITEVGGSQSWVLDRKNAKSCDYAVLYFNAHATWSEKNFAVHGTGFLVGRIADVVPSPVHAGRWLVVFDQFAETDELGIWGGWRNPIRYTTLEELGVDIAQLNFKPMPKREEKETSHDVATNPESADQGLTIEAAKIGLSAMYGVKPEAIEIIIRG